jgi:DNA helicase-2/ATP-dependent DNA helicase PcrA
MVSTSEFTPSKYQVAIEDHFRKMIKTNGGSSLLVNAVAGAGKSSELQRLCEILKAEGVDTSGALAVAFNRDIVAELKVRLDPTGTTVKTINGLGHGALWLHLGRKNLTVESYKYNNIVSEYLENMAIPKKVINETGNAVTKLINFCMSSLVGMKSDGSFDLPTNEEIIELVGRYSLDLPSALSDIDTFNMIRSALVKGEQMARNRILSFDDQVFMPIKWNINLKKYSYIFVDEANDLSPQKLELCLRSGNDNTKYVFLGDRFQSIYTWAGSDINSIDKIIERTKATVLPMSYSYRCPKAVIREAQKLYPDIEAAPGAPEGIVREILDTELVNEIQNGSMVLCRKNAPLVSLVIQLLAQKKPAKLRGRDVGKSIVTFVKNALGKNGTWAEAGRAMEDFYTAQYAKISGYKNPETQLENLADKYQCAKVLYESFTDVKSVEEFATAVNGLFSDEQALITASSIHKAKGSQAKTVYILKPEFMPLKYKNQSEVQKQEEIHIFYVALTRSQRELVFVRTT